MNINDFKAELGDGARANQYKVTLTFPAAAFAGADVTRKVSFLCKTAQIPGQTVGNIQVPFRGRQIPVPGDRTFEDWTITVMNDDKFVIRDAFERWHNALSFHSEPIGIPISEIYSDGTVEQLNRQGETIKTYEIKGMFPTSITGIELGYDTNDAISETSVTLAYTYWASRTTA